MAGDFQRNERLAGEREDLRRRCRKILVASRGSTLSRQQWGYTSNFDDIAGHLRIYDDGIRYFFAWNRNASSWIREIPDSIVAMIRFMGLILSDPSLSEIFDEFMKVILENH